MFTCPGCGMLVQIITNKHLELHHNGMSKAEFKAQYGDKLTLVSLNTSREYRAWLDSFPIIKNADYEVAQASGRTMNKR